MSGGLEQLRQAVVQQLNQGGLDAAAALEPQAQRDWPGPVAAVSLRGVQCAPGGFDHYLGLRRDPEKGEEAECYGRRVELTLGLDLYAPRSGGQSACQAALARLSELLLSGGAGGLDVVELTAQEVQFLHQEGLYRLPAQCRCAGWLIARADSAGCFTDFEVKGRIA